MVKRKIRLLLADDTLIAREGWKKILETAGEIEIVGEASRAIETIQKARDLQPDVILVDLKWFGDDTAGWSAISEIKSQVSHAKIIAVTAYENLIRDARKAGADSALLKTFTREELIKTITDLGKENQNSEENIPLHKQFSPREIDIIERLIEGLSDREIADRMNITPASVKNHIKSILDKFEVDNRKEAVILATKQDIVNQSKKS